MEKVHNDLRILKAFDFVFLFIAFVLSSGVLYIGSQTAKLDGIEHHLDQISERMDNHESRLKKIESMQY